jgi:[acyl-carrier-protein] S-malonyltransferase
MSKLSIVFPGQGSQAVGMLAELQAAHPEVKETFAEVSAACGRDLWRLAQEGPAESLSETRNTQPAMLAAGVAVWRVWQAQGGPAPTLLAGHSLGEYSALVCAGAIELGAAARLVAERARLMQEAVPLGAGAMAALLGLDDDAVRELCRQAAQGEIVEAVNFNAPGQVVVAGQRAAVERVMALAKTAGAKRALALPVSVPSHCQLMRPAAEQLAETLARTPIDTPRIPVLHNASVAATDDPGQVRALLALQLYQPVRWVETVRAMTGAGVGLLLEAGPGKVLSGLAKRIDKDLKALPVFDPASLTLALEEANHVE